jgi:hypothetical protein
VLLLMLPAALKPAVVLQRHRKVAVMHEQPRVHWPRAVQLMLAHDRVVGRGEGEGEAGGLKSSSAHCGTVQQSTAQHSTVQCNAVQSNAVQYSKCSSEAQHSTVQCSCQQQCH